MEMTFKREALESTSQSHSLDINYRTNHKRKEIGGNVAFVQELVKNTLHSQPKVVSLRSSKENAVTKGGSIKRKKRKREFSVQLIVPNNKVGLVIGKSGQTVKSIQLKHNCSVKIPSSSEGGNPDLRTITVLASRLEDANAAKEEILGTYSVNHRVKDAFVTSGEVESFCTIPNDKVGLVIGKGGANIKLVMQTSKCDIQIPTIADFGSNPQTRTLSIKGFPASIEDCIKQLTKLVHRKVVTSRTKQKVQVDGDGDYKYSRAQWLVRLNVFLFYSNGRPTTKHKAKTYKTKLQNTSEQRTTFKIENILIYA